MRAGKRYYKIINEGIDVIQDSSFIDGWLLINVQEEFLARSSDGLTIGFIDDGRQLLWLDVF